jgi:hypothetical protein
MKVIARLLALVAATSFILPASAETVYLLTQDNSLVTFDSASPGAAPAPVAVTGLGGFDLVGIDIRTTVQTRGAANPGVGSLWAIGVSGTNTRLFVINPTTAAAAPIGPVLTGIDGSGDGDNGWFFGHDPGNDRFRLINFNKNYELNPNTMTFVRQTDLTGNPNVNGSAFLTASFGQRPPIFFLRQGMATDLLSTSTNIASGAYAAVGSTGLDFTLGAGLDIAGGLTLMATPISGTANLYSINRNTGAATLLGAIGGNPSIRALTIRPASFPPRLPVVVKVSGPKRIVTSSAVARIRGTARSLAGIKRVDYRVGNAKPKRAQGAQRWTARVRVGPGSSRVSFRATGGNDVVSRPASVRIIRR